MCRIVRHARLPYAPGAAVQSWWDGHGGGQTLGRSVAVGMVYARSTLGETKQPRLGFINIQDRVSPIHNSDLSLTA